MNKKLELSLRSTVEVSERIVADAVMLNMAIIAAFVGRLLALLYLAGQSLVPSSSLSAMLDESVSDYLHSAGLLTLICLSLFWFFGFYTHGRAYRGRYKALIVFQAVTLSYLLFGFLTLFVPFLSPFPRSVLLSAWILTVVALEAARLWSYVWKQKVRAESRLHAAPCGAIRNILVIGGAGYIGSILVRKLLQRGYSVTVLDALIYGDESIRELYGHPHLEFVKGDFRDITKVVSTMRGIDAVVHLGALVGDPACAINEKLTIEINFAATRMIAEVAKGFGVQRFLFSSTCSVYGASDGLSREESELNPVSLYARTKISSEQALLSLAGRRFAPTIVRFATIFGWSPRPRFDLVVNLLTARAMADKTISIMGGQQWRPFLHVADAAEAMVRCLEAPVGLVKGEIFNVGSDRENYQIAQIGELIKRAVPEVAIVTNGEDPDQRNYRVSFQKFSNRVGFTPSKTVAEGIEEMKGHIEKGEVSDYRDTKYSNYKTLAEEGIAVPIQRDDPASPLCLVGNSQRTPSSDQSPAPGSRPSGGRPYPIIKRALDILAAGVGLVLLSPLGFLIGLFIKLTDRGPIFFGQTRIGQFGQPFRIWKFRSMVINAETMGGPVTGQDDPRITWLGRLLRQTKLDEIPQLWNVLVGDMSLVGPRPEVPRYVDLYTPEQGDILQYKPGITDLASLLFRNEEELLRGAEDLEGFYLRYCLPKKIELNRQHAEHATLLQDLWIIFQTVCPYWLRVLMIYLISFTFSFWVVYQLKSDFRVTRQDYEQFKHFLPLMVLPQLICLVWRGQLRGLLSYFSIPEMRPTFVALGVALVVQVGLGYSIYGRLAPPPSIMLMDFIVSFLMVCGVRMTLRLLRERASRARPDSQAPARRVALVGTGELATNLVLDFARSEKPARRVVAFFDDNPRNWRKRPHNIPVIGMPECLLNREWQQQIDEVIVALPEENAPRIQEIGEMLKGLRPKVTIASGWPVVSAFPERGNGSNRGNGLGKCPLGVIGAGYAGAALANKLAPKPA
jgi:lipopolysaccharide/colanic/teichoic acid biosynthesis glycosyltransferase/nucleoside-diphosphate-sugar epimerase